MNMRQDRPDDGGEGKGLGGGPSLATIAWLVIAAALVALVLQNGDKVEINFLFISIDAKEWVLIIISMLLGALLGWLLPRILFDRDKKK